MTQASNSAVASLREVWKTYRVGSEAVHALAGVSLEIERGSFWAVMGPSGSGKSTLLNLLGCLDRPTRGNYLVNGQDLSALDDDALSDNRLRHLGFIFQSFHLIAQLNVRENIELPLYYLGWDAAASARRAEQLAALVGLEERLNHRPNELSGGQQQRVAIARALVNDPAMLLADEPTGNLDSATGTQIMELLRQLNREGKTIIMVTHEPEIAAWAGGRILIRDGRIAELEGSGRCAS